MPSKNKSNDWLVSWDMYGLEALINLTSWKVEYDAHEKKVMWETLKNEQYQKDKAPQLPIKQMILRAQVNPQRCYEIYTFSSVGLSRDDIKDWFADSPQSAADWVREHGSKIYCGRSSVKALIT